LYDKILHDLPGLRYGSSHATKVVLNSFDFGESSKLQQKGNWKALESLEKVGANCLLI
jgi:aspartate/glutamate racemase